MTSPKSITSIFTVPHPALAFLRSAEPPFYLEPQGHTDLGSSDVQFEGRIWRRDGVSNPVRSIHKTFADYINAIAPTPSRSKSLGSGAFLRLRVVIGRRAAHTRLQWIR